MRSTAISAVLILVFACTALAQDEVFSDDFETGLPYSWSSWQAWAPSVEIEPDFAGLASQYVEPEDGATTTAVGSDGTEYRLTIPPNALVEPVVIIMIPIASIPNLPLTGGLGAGVELLPDGLTFFKPATLEITPVSGTVPDTAVGFAFKENGQGFHLYPHLEESGTVTIPITGFSGFGFGLAGDLGPLSGITGTAGGPYLNAIAAPLRDIVQDLNAGSDPDPADVAKIKTALKDWYDNVVKEAADDASACAGSCCSSMAEQLGEANNKMVMWETTIDLLGDGVAPISDFEAEFDHWEDFETSFCGEIDSCDEACAAAATTCDSFDQIPDLLEVQETLDAFGITCGVYTADEICQGLSGYRLAGIEMQCSDKIPVGGSTQLVAVPKSWTGQDVGKAHLNNPTGGPPIEWISYYPSVASLAGLTSDLAVTVEGNDEGVALVGVTLTQCERTVVGGCVVEVGEPLRVRIGGCEWDSTSCHLPSLAGGSTTVDVEALFEGAEPTDQIQIAVQPYRPLGDINIVSSASSCSQFPGDWGGLGCAGTAAPGERFTVGLTGLEPEFPVFAVHVKAQFEGAEREAVAWAYSTDICYSEATSWYGWWTYPGTPTAFSETTATGAATYLYQYSEPPDSIDAHFRGLAGAATCEDNWKVQVAGLWWDTLIVIPKDLRLFEYILDTRGTLETPISGAAFATAASSCEPEQAGIATWAYVDGYSETWSWELIPDQDTQWFRFHASDYCWHEPSFAVRETDHTVYPHIFGGAFRLIGRGDIRCLGYFYREEDRAHSHVNASVTWDVVNAMTWGDQYLSLHDFRIFSCSGEFDLNWPP